MKSARSYLLLITLIFFTLNAGAQIGIGTITPQAQVDIPATNPATPANTDGILIPRVNAFPAANPTAAQQGMLVFLTATVGASVPGFYYWNNPTLSWIGIGSTNNWSLLGNAGTLPATNFLGTTNDQDMVFKRNNIRSGFVGNPNTTTGNMNTSFGANSLRAAATGTRNTAFGTNIFQALTSGTRNTAVGERAMFTNTTGSDNSALGVGALFSNVGGSFNTALGRNAMTTNDAGDSNSAVGYRALRDNTSGSYNTATGTDAMQGNTTGTENTATGVSALLSNLGGSYNVANGVQASRGNTSGTNNVALGYQSLFTGATGSGNVAVGYQAGYSETGSNKLYIENSNANAVNALVYGEFDNNIVRVNGQLQVADPATTGYKFPLARGTNKQTLETDAAGNVSWANPNNSLSVMRTKINADQGLSTSGWQKINFNTVVFDSNNEFAVASTRFVATKAGYYRVNAGYHIFGISTTQYFSIGVWVNGLEYQETSANHHNMGPVVRNINCIVSLNAGDYIEIFAQNYENGVTIDSYFGKTFFEVQQIK